MSESFNNGVRIGQEGVDAFHQNKYAESKDKCIEACKILQAFKNQGSESTKRVVKGYMLQFLTIAESASQKLGPNNHQNKGKENNLFLQQIQANMIVKADTTFDDIVGLDNIKQVIKQAIIYPNMRPDLYKGIRSPPRGILFYGPPGNGKTLMAKAVATECKSTFFNVTASSLVSKWVGDSERMLKTIFSQAYRRQPSIIFFDEIDAILTSRSENENDASRRLKTQFLVQLDGVGTTDNDRVLLIAATNLPNQLDKAALRRFTKKILIDLPDTKARKHMISKELKAIKSDIPQWQLNDISNLLELYSAADIKNLIKEAVMMPIREHSYEKLLNIRIEQIRNVKKIDFIKAIEIAPPTLNKQQYLKYKRFGDDEGKEDKPTTAPEKGQRIVMTNNYVTSPRVITQTHKVITPTTGNIIRKQQTKAKTPQRRVIHTETIRKPIQTTIVKAGVRIIHFNTHKVQQLKSGGTSPKKNK